MATPGIAARAQTQQLSKKCKQTEPRPCPELSALLWAEASLKSQSLLQSPKHRVRHAHDAIKLTRFVAFISSKKIVSEMWETFKVMIVSKWKVTALCQVPTSFPYRSTPRSFVVKRFRSYLTRQQFDSKSKVFWTESQVSSTKISEENAQNLPNWQKFLATQVSSLKFQS